MVCAAPPAQDDDDYVTDAAVHTSSSAIIAAAYSHSAIDHAGHSRTTTPPPPCKAAMNGHQPESRTMEQSAVSSSAAGYPQHQPQAAVSIAPADGEVQVQDVLRIWNAIASCPEQDREKLLSSLSPSSLAQSQQLLLQFQSLLPSSSSATSSSSSVGSHHPTTAEKENSDVDLSTPPRFLQWIVRSWFPPLSDPSVNYLRLNPPWIAVTRLLSLPLAVRNGKPASWWFAFLTFIGVFVSLTCIGLLQQYYTVDGTRDWPVLFASLGALTTIVFSTPSQPVVQPYHMFMGTLVGSFFGVTIQRGLGSGQLLWLSAALSGAVSVTVMQLLGCTHPPAGALALLYVTVPTAQVLGYWFILAAEVGAFMTFLTALLVNNFAQLESKRFPRGWVG